VKKAVTAARFSSLLFTALALAHLLELPNKIGLARDDYLTVQQIYRGWALLGIVVVAALISTASHILDVHLSGEPGDGQLDGVAR
jgi:hypothetical protein